MSNTDDSWGGTDSSAIGPEVNPPQQWTASSGSSHRPSQLPSRWRLATMAQAQPDPSPPPPPLLPVPSAARGIRGIVRCVCFEVARSAPFITVYIKVGLPPAMLVLRSTSLILRFAALASTLFELLSRRMSYRPGHLSLQISNLVARLNDHLVLFAVELLLTGAICVQFATEAKHDTSLGIDDALLMVMFADIIQTAVKALEHFSLAMPSIPASRADAGSLPASPAVDIIPYDRASEEGSGDGEDVEEVCVICLSGFMQGEEVARLPCRHIFHPPCIWQWLQMKPTCPLRCQHATTLGRPIEAQAGPADNPA